MPDSLNSLVGTMTTMDSMDVFLENHCQNMTTPRTTADRWSSTRLLHDCIDGADRFKQLRPCAELKPKNWQAAWAKCSKTETTKGGNSTLILRRIIGHLGSFRQWSMLRTTNGRRNKRVVNNTVHEQLSKCWTAKYRKRISSLSVRVSVED